ncbi:MAG: hypothetical protein KatS3mg111_0210 [Pirellulaceae bacterium]|nr:MAG: hypothetical protein KatS3mg111_0210 [Pirellulaceae bacterium]
MHDDFIEFVRRPSQETFLAVRQQLLESEEFDPTDDALHRIDRLLFEERYEEAGQAIAEAMPNFLLSPRMHLMIAYLAEKQNDEEARDTERYIASACCAGIESTGDGTMESPYRVMRPADEYDMLDFLGLEFKNQAMVADGQRRLDVIHCADGTQVFFDITELVSPEDGVSEFTYEPHDDGHED